MPILDIQYRLRELGRLRMGKKGNRGAPVKLETWRLTTAARDLLEAAAEIYGGDVEPWDDAPNGTQYQLFTESDTVDIVIPPGEAAFSQFYELWSGGGCKKRCDGERQYTRDVACSCPKDSDQRRELAQRGEACKETTRFNVILPRIPDIGIWRLESHGYYAAIELAGVTQLLRTANGNMIQARLRIDQRSRKVPGQAIKRYTVPVLELPERLDRILQALGAPIGSVSLPAPVEPRSLPGERPALPTDPSFQIEKEDPEMGAASRTASTPAPQDGGDGPPAVGPLRPWITALLEAGYPEPDIIDAAQARGAPVERLRDFDSLADKPESERQWAFAVAEELKSRRQGSGGGTESASEPPSGVVEPPDPAPPMETSDTVEDAQKALDRARMKRLHHLEGKRGWYTCEEPRLYITTGEKCPVCDWEPPPPRCPACGSGVQPWKPDDKNKPTWLCSNEDCKGWDGEHRWTSFHSDPWREGGEIDQHNAPAQEPTPDPPTGEQGTDGDAPHPASVAAPEQAGLGRDGGDLSGPPPSPEDPSSPVQSKTTRKKTTRRRASE